MEFNNDNNFSKNKGDGVRCDTYRRSKCSEKDVIMAKGNNGSGESSPNTMTYRSTGIKCYRRLYGALAQDVDRNKSASTSSSTKSENHLQNCFRHAYNVTHRKSSSEQLVYDTPRPGNEAQYYTDTKKEGSKKNGTDFAVKNTSYIISEDGYCNSVGSLSLSLTSLLSSENDEEEACTVKEAKRGAFDSWLKRKEAEKRAMIIEKDKKKNTVNPKEKGMTSEQKEILFRKWLAKKQALKEENKAEILAKQLKEEKQKKEKLLGKEEKMKEWNMRKIQVMKEIKMFEKEQTSVAELAKEQKKKEGEEAYRQWLQRTKQKPFPVPSNKGPLNVRPPAFVNPHPWYFDETVYSTN